MARKYDPRRDKAPIDIPTKVHPQTPAEPENVDYVEEKKDTVQEQTPVEKVEEKNSALDDVANDLSQHQEEIKEDQKVEENIVTPSIDENEEELKRVEKLVNQQREPNTQLKNIKTPVEQARDFYENQKNQMSKQTPMQDSAPLYNLTRDPKTGKVTVRASRPAENQDFSSDKKSLIEEMIQTIEKEILKLEIEIEVHQQLESKSTTQEEMLTNQRRIESYRNNKSYLLKKKNVLLSMK